MPKPEARASGAPIQWFTREKTKKEPDFRAANQKAYDAANEQIMLWHAQYQRNFGRLPPNYAMRTNLPPVEPTPFKPSKPKKGAKTGVSVVGGIPIDESMTTGTKKKKTEHEETVALKESHENVNRVIDQLKLDTDEGKVRAEIEGINKKDKKGFFERNIGAKIGAVGAGLGETFVGDWTARGFNLASRIPEAGTAFLQSAAESGVNLSSDPLQGGGTGATGDPKDLPEYRKWSKSKRDAADAAYKELLKQRTNPFNEAWQGLQGKRKGTSWMDYYTNKELAERGDLERFGPYGKALLVGGGLATDVTIDPQNALGFGVVAKGVRAAKKGRDAEKVVTAVRRTGLVNKVAEETKEAVKGKKIVDDLIAGIGDEVPTAPTWKAPLELGPGKPVTSKGFEFTDDVTHAARADEIAQAARKSAEIKDASEAGFRSLRNTVAKQARTLATAKKATKAGKMSEAELALEVAHHTDLLKRMEAAQQVRQVAKATPVGKSTSLLEKQVDRLTKLASKSPQNKQLAQKLAVANRDLEAARLAALPDNADQILDIVKAASKGEEVKIGKDAMEAIVHASPEVQDELITVLKDAEVKTKAGQKVKHTGDSADLPSTRVIAELDKAAADATVTAATKATFTEAAQIVSEGASSPQLTRLADEMLKEAELLGRPLTKAGVKSKVAQKAAEWAEDEGILANAKAATGRKINELRATGEKLIPSTQKMAMLQDSLLEEILPSIESLTRILEDGVGKRFVIRFAGKDLGEFAPIGNTLRAMYVPFELTGKLGGRATGGLFGKAFRMGSHFPDETNFLRQMAENEGISTHIEWAKEVTKKFTNNITDAEAKQIREAIEDGTELSTPDLEALRQEAIRLSDEIFQKQAAMGKYVPNSKVKNYVYHYYHSRNRKAIKTFKDVRTNDMRNGLKGGNITDAKKLGLKPEERIDRILIMQHRDFVRDLQRANFRQSVVSMFGTLTDNPALANGLGLEEVSGDSMNKMFQDAAAAKKAKYYLPPEIHDTFKAMDEMMNIGHNGKADDYLRFYDGLVRGFKTSATIYNPANWVNNTAGDVFLNWVDGVKSPRWYTTATRLIYRGLDSPRTISVGGKSMDSNVLLRAFRTKSPSGGFIRTEGMGHVSRFGRKGPLGYPSRAARRVQGVYEGREETMRLAHFMHATDDEMKRLMSKGMSYDKAFEVGTELAAKRVAKWNIDYTALTPFERQLRRRFIPFYTFMRKATPLMFEAMLTRPGKIAHYNMSQRAIEKLMGVPPIEEDDAVWNEWTKQQGITRLTQEDEPLYARDPSPLNVLNRVLGGTSIQAPGKNILNTSAPPIKTFVEAHTGRSLYNDQEIDNWRDFWLGQLPTASIAARIIGHPLSPQKAGKEEGGKGTAILERLSTIGIPIGRNTEARQQAAIYSQMGNKDEIFKKANEAVAPFEIRKQTTDKNGTYWNVKDPAGNIISRHRDFVMAVRAAQVQHNG